METIRYPVFPDRYIQQDDGEYKVQTKDLKDCRSNPIRVGSRVAYNQSGSVTLGIVKEIKGHYRQQSWGPQWDGYFKVQNLLHPKDKASKVKRPESMMVLLFD